MVKSDDGRDVPVVQAFAFGKYLGHLKVTFDEAGNVVKAEGNPILMDSSIPQGRLQPQQNRTGGLNIGRKAAGYKDLT